MERAEYERMNRLEDRMWWYRAAHANLLAAFSRRSSQHAAGPILDAGCGTGGLLARLCQALPNRQLVGLDSDLQACLWARAKSGVVVANGSVDALPIADGALAAIFSVDVLCHRDVEPAAALSEARRCLGAGGLLVVNVPAYRWLMSAHDERVHNTRRFTLSELKALFAEAGLALVEGCYWNSLLFPLMMARRLIFKPSGAASDVIEYSRLLEWLFRAATDCERRLMALGLSLPFGGSVLAVAVRHD